MEGRWRGCFGFEVGLECGEGERLCGEGDTNEEEDEEEKGYCDEDLREFFSHDKPPRGICYAYILRERCLQKRKDRKGYLRSWEWLGVDEGWLLGGLWEV